ncbi:MAG: rhombosortase [Pseudomonadota bacterium]
MTRGAAGGFAWIGVALLLGAVALLGWPVARDALDWQPGLALREPWRAFSAVGVHYSGQHLGVNLIGLVVTALFGMVARAPQAMALAWLAAWPLTQIGLLLKPELLHYGGLSGVLHAGVAIVVAWLLITGTRGQRWVVAAVAVGGIAKLLNEAPWGPALRHPAGWDIAIAPLAHTTGAVAGAVCATLAVRLACHRVARDV